MAIGINSGINTGHISSNNYRDYEAARSGFFILLISQEELTNLLTFNYTGDAVNAKEGDFFTPAEFQKGLQLAVTKCDVPNYTVQKLTYRRGNDVVHMAGTPEFSDGSITVDDYVGLNTKDMLYSWLRLAYDPYTRKGGRMKDYKKHATLMEYTQDYELVRSWNLEGVFVTGISEDSFDRENDGKRQLTVQLSYDRAVMDKSNTAEIAEI